MSTSAYCDDCGTIKRGPYCLNCHEEIFIEEQYIEEGEPVPKVISDQAEEYRRKEASK